MEFVLLLTDEVESEVDDSVFRDAESLSGGKPYSVLHTVSEGDPPDKMTTIVLEYRGKGQEAEPGTTPPSPHAVGEDGDDTSTPWAEMVGYNAATGNEFSLSLPPGVIDAETLEDAVANLSTEAGPTAAGPQADGHRDTLGSAPRTQTSWSNNDDDRIRIYGVNAAVAGVNRWLFNMSGGCTGVLVGDRQFLTAAHCAYNLNNDTWSLTDTRGWIGRNGTSWRIGNWGQEVNLNPDLVDPGDSEDALWYWVDANYIANNDSSYDFAVITVPKSERWGSQVAFSGQSWFQLDVQTDADLQAEAAAIRGYSSCANENPTFNGSPRIDEPCQGASGQSCSTCNVDHIYGQTYTGTVGALQSSGRVFKHSVDTSAGDSGAPVYAYLNSAWRVIGIHYASECGRIASEPACASTDATPSRATRMTSSRKDTIVYFRGIFP